MFACVCNRFRSKKGGKTKEKEGHAFVGRAPRLKMGSTFSLLYNLLRVHHKQNSCPTAGTYIYTILIGQTTDRQFRTRSARAKTVPQLAKRSNHLSHRARQEEKVKEIEKSDDFSSSSSSSTMPLTHTRTSSSATISNRRTPKCRLLLLLLLLRRVYDDEQQKQKRY